MMTCGVCRCSKRNGPGSVYCRLFGIMIRASYTGCKYFDRENEGNDTDDRNRMADTAEERPAR